MKLVQIIIMSDSLIWRSWVQVLLWPLVGICSGWSQVQILRHACKYPTGCLLPVGVLNPVMLYLNYMFLSIQVECL